VNLWKVARSAADKILARTTDLEARRRIVKMVQKKVLQPAESEQIRLGSAVFERSLAVCVVLTCLKLTVVWQLQVMKKAQVGEVLAIRPGEDEDLINEESGEEILEGSVRFLSDFWLARVKEPYCKVDDTDDDG